MRVLKKIKSFHLRSIRELHGNNELKNLGDGAKEYFDAVKKANENVKSYLQSFISTGRILKGYEIVGWYGEIVTQELLGGAVIADDTKDYDVVNSEKNEKYSVKTRMGTSNNWKVTSLIPNNTIDEESPSHLVFVHLNDIRLNRYGATRRNTWLITIGLGQRK